MTAPTDFDSFVAGFDLTAANYSGGAGGTFANLVSGGQAWTVNGATPSFATNNGLSGMDFANSATESILGKMPALWEATILCICKTGTLSVVYPFGGNYSAGNSFGLQNSAHAMRAFLPSGSSPLTSTDSSMNSRANVQTVSFSPFNATAYAQFNDGIIASATIADGENCAVNYPDAAIGRHRTTYYTGWIGRVLIFSRALHYRDNDNLQSLIETEMASIGL